MSLAYALVGKSVKTALGDKLLNSTVSGAVEVASSWDVQKALDELKRQTRSVGRGNLLFLAIKI